MKALALLSGGLDSILAARIVIEQGVEVSAINFSSVFYTSTEREDGLTASKNSAKALGVDLEIIDISADLIELVKKPVHGYGAHLNPCLDCHILMCRKAAERMRHHGASFLVTGEVVGERPMSQKKRDLDVVEKKSACDGLILRPLSAQLLAETIPEKEGWVDRGQLYSISGRSRKQQFRLAEQFGISEYLTPAGGCLLTDTGFSRRLGDLMQRKPDFTPEDSLLLKVGRHFRLSDTARLVVGRDQKENERLEKIAQTNDIVIYPTTVPGPVGIMRGRYIPADLALALSVMARYCDAGNNEPVELEYRTIPDERATICHAKALTGEPLEILRI